MNKYIEQEVAIKALMNDAPEKVEYSREDAADCIRHMDAADVECCGKLRGVTYEDGKVTAVYIRDTDDVVKVFTPVRHGRWDDEHKCTVCHNEAFFKISDIRPDYDYDWEENLVETGNYIWDTEWIEPAYCPNCGAKMDGGED